MKPVQAVMPSIMANDHPSANILSKSTWRKNTSIYKIHIGIPSRVDASLIMISSSWHSIGLHLLKLQMPRLCLCVPCQLQIRLYSPSQISEAETWIGLTRKKGSTTAYQALLPINKLKRWAFWNLPYPHGDSGHSTTEYD